MERYSREVADAIEWSGTRVLCVAGDFTKFDEHAVAQIGRNIELIRYKYFSDDLLMLEWVNPVQESGGAAKLIQASRESSTATQPVASGKKAKDESNTFAAHFAAMSEDVNILYDEMYSFVMSLGDDINAKELRLYLAFSRLKNFICLLPMKGGLKLWVKLNPETVQLEEGFSRDVSSVGHWGTGDVEVYIRSKEDLTKAKPLLEQAYQEN